MKYWPGFLVFLLLTGCMHFRRTPTLLPPVTGSFMHGMSLVNENNTPFDSQAGRRSLRNLQQTGLPWIVFIVNGFQDTINSTQIYYHHSTPTTHELARATAHARQLNLQVVYKFHIDNIHDSSQHWRGQIGQNWKTDQERRDWFENYRQFIWPYAKTAEKLKIPLLCIGNELTTLESHGNYWVSLIKDIRKDYHGALVYGTNWDSDHDHVAWWNELDFIGVSAYYPIITKDNPTRKDLVQSWQYNHHLRRLEYLSAFYRKPVIFTEIGYRSVDGNNRTPWEYRTSPPLDLMAQADLYFAAINFVQTQLWIKGMFWWAWHTDPTVGGTQNTGYTPFGKPAEQLLRILKRP